MNTPLVKMRYQQLVIDLFNSDTITSANERHKSSAQGVKSCPTTHIYTPSSYTHAIQVYLRMRGTVNWWAGLSITDSWSLTSLLRVGHRVATLLDSMRKSILALRYNFWRLQGTQSCRGKPVLICILALSLVFTPYLSNAVVSAKSPHLFSCPCSTEAVGIAHKPPRSL